MSEAATVATVPDTDFEATSTYEAPAPETPKEPAKPKADEPSGRDAITSDEDDLSEAAAKLGEKGGKASAAKRAEQATGQTDADKADAAPAANDPTKDTKKGNPRHDPTARVAQATREAKEARERAEAAERRAADRDRLAAELEQLRSGKPAPAKEEAKPAAPVDPNRPKVEDFEKYEDYVEAVADYKAEARFKQFQERQQAEQQHAARSQYIGNTIKSYTDRIAEAKAADPTFIERTSPLLEKLVPSFLVPDGQVGNQYNVLADEIMKSAQSAALLSYFADNDAEYQRMGTLLTIPDIQAEVRYIAKGLAAAPQAPAPKTEISKARPPVRPVTGAPASSGGPDPDDEDNFDQWVKYHNAKEASRR